MTAGPFSWGTAAGALLEAAYEGAQTAWTACADGMHQLLSDDSSETATIEGTQYRAVGRVVGEGGFSTVYLVESTATREQFAMKRMVCPKNGSDLLAMARHEVAAYGRFRHANIIRLVGHSEEAVAVGGGTAAVVVRMVFPLFRRGSLADAVEQRNRTGQPLAESFIVGALRGLCGALQLLHAETELGGGPFAHRDVKLENALVGDDGGTVVLADFGSARPARMTANTRADALRIQEEAAEACSSAYRAPELFDVQTGATVDERADVWALGCLAFALAYGFTPFADPRNEGAGASAALAAINANYAHPQRSAYPDGRLRRLIDAMLQPDAQRRPTIGQVAALADELYPPSISGEEN
ncbi:Serine/threonine-protein kinase env7 [Coemansia sp. RSA 1939]|nr:Serine/threonine-protein kinase env7 [Coemansia sp. RSA 1939]KAJ2617823.1 Serine/threonine-protein kinase env7 [Coemansia sp. RSA 1804]KAJ2695197.1 Serine/threonine-protein kinase env7 [Coemansia sp. RSA 1285]